MAGAGSTRNFNGVPSSDPYVEPGNRQVNSANDAEHFHCRPFALKTMLSLMGQTLISPLKCFVSTIFLFYFLRTFVFMAPCSLCSTPRFTACRDTPTRHSMFTRESGLRWQL